MELFEASELELLICGSKKLDFDDLRRGARYEDGFNETSPTVLGFWTVVMEFNDEEKSLFLKFLSGRYFVDHVLNRRFFNKDQFCSDRAPIEGLSKLSMVISKNGNDDNRLPSAHTCFNHILLPDYSNLHVLREKLRYAITHTEGFGLR